MSLLHNKFPKSTATDVHPSLAGATNYEPKHEEYWNQLTLQEAVARGERLRAQKARAPRRDKEYKVVDIEYIKRPTLKKRGSRTCSCASSRHKKSRLKNTPKRQGSSDLTTCKKHKKSLTCSMRIKELAVPKKRLCLDTWRENYRILPETMVNRLRQHVLDERVVVKVDDAIRCFRNKRKKKKKSSFNQVSALQRYPIKSVKKMDELKCLCWKFAGKMCKQLIVPLKIRLNPQQQRVAQIVARDIKDMMRSRKECDLGYNKILYDVSNMVSVWISTILEETSNRLLDEALRELEEEEGPVLDILDSIVDVIRTSEDSLVGTSEASDNDHEDEREGMESSQLNTEKIIDEMGDSEDYAPTEKEVHSESDFIAPEDAAFLKAALSENSVKSRVISNGDRDAIKTSSGVELVDEEKPEKYEDGELSDKDREQNAEEILEEEKQVKYRDTEMLEKHLGTEFVGANKLDVLKDTEVSDKELESLDEHKSNFKVIAEKSLVADNVDQETKKSLDTEMAGEEQLGEFKDIELSQGHPDTELVQRFDDSNREINPAENEVFVDADDTMDLKGDDQKKVTFDALGTNLLTPSQTNHKSNALTKKLNPPNDHILSGADESWPKDLVLPVNTKPLEAVNKSVTSLGNITETLEKNQSPNVEPEEPQSKGTTEKYVDALAIDQPKHDNISSQIESSAIENKAEKTGISVNNNPVPFIPFNKYTETGEEKLPEKENEDGLKENEEIENISKQITIPIKDVMPSITAEVEPNESQLLVNQSDIDALTELKLVEKHNSISSQIETENKAPETETIVNNSLVPSFSFNKSTETGEEKYPELEGDGLKEDKTEHENKSEKNTNQTKDMTPSIRAEVEPNEPQLFVNPSGIDIVPLKELKLVEKHDRINSQIESVTENKAQDIGTTVNNTPMSSIPLIKHTETGEQKHLQIENEDGLREENIEHENKLEQFSIQKKYVTPSIKAEVELIEPQLLVNQSEIVALTELKLVEKHESIGSQLESATENKDQAIGTIVDITPVPSIPLVKYTETGVEKLPEIENEDSFKVENIEIKNKSEQITIKTKDKTPSIKGELEPKEPQLFVNESDINIDALTESKLVEKHDSIISQLESVTENKAKRITVEMKNVTPPIRPEVEPKEPQLFVQESFIDALKLEKSEAPLIIKTLEQMPVIKTGYESVESNHGVIGLRNESEELKPDGQLKSKSKLPETEHQSPMLNDELNLLAKKLGDEIKSATEVSSEPKSKEMSTTQSLLEVITKPVDYSDQIAEGKLEHMLDYESTTQESEQENIEVRSSDTLKQVTEVSDELKKKTIDGTIKIVSRKPNVEHQATPQNANDTVVSNPHSKLHKPKSEVIKVQKLVVNLTKQLVDTKFKDEEKSDKIELRTQTLEDKNYKKAKEIKIQAKEQKQPIGEQSRKQTKNGDINIRAKTSKKAKTKSKVSDQPKGKLIPAKAKSIIVRTGDILVPGVKEALIAQPKFDYKVYLETAPSWVRNQGKGEPSEDSLLMHIRERQRLKERKRRQWCHDLEATAINLEKWCHWIDDASANVMYLKRKQCCDRNAAASKGGLDKNWIDLKTCIDKDALLWSKLCHRAVRKLNKYRQYAES